MLATNYELHKIEVMQVVQENNVLIPKEDIERMYHEYYMMNLQSLIKENRYIGFKWYAVEDLESMESKSALKFTDYQGDSYLKNMEDKRQLGLDILANGTFWPISVMHTDRHENETFKGSHRTISAQILQSEGKWDGRKLLAIDLKEHVNTSPWEFYSRNRKPQNVDLYFVPTMVLYPELFSEDVNMDEIKADVVSRGGYIVDKYFVKIPINNYRDLIRILAYCTIWLREVMQFNTQKTGYEFKPLSVLNSEKEFEAWHVNRAREFGIQL